jgi:exopolysaccharide biosynthesis polyprenyl glycosylphosphotransferase
MRLNPEIMSPWMRAVKRSSDVGIALVVSIISLPLMLVIGALVKLTSPGPVIFSQERVGLKGHIFIMHKFRSMWENAEQLSGPVWARPDDPRVTPLGRFLRRFRLDELPQFWNVLKGDMSIVGPRPERKHFVDLLGEELAYYRRRLAVRPGLTGWAQVRGSYDNSLEDVRSKLKDDLYYIENGSLRLDLIILLLTIKVLISGRGQ